MSDRYVSRCQPPEGLTRELLVILAEECAEVIHCVTKALRFGLDEVKPAQPHTNATRISLEVGDIIATLGELQDAGVIHPDDVADGIRHKRRQLAKYLQNKADKETTHD